jgi:hypothetical protein
MKCVFFGARAFYQPLAGWEVSKATTMQSMFGGARAFYQPLADWEVSKVTTMQSMSGGARAFNQPFADWDALNAKDMKNMLFRAAAFNQPLTRWVSKVKDMQHLVLFRFKRYINTYMMPKESVFLLTKRYISVTYSFNRVQCISISIPAPSSYTWTAAAASYTRRPRCRQKPPARRMHFQR